MPSFQAMNDERETKAREWRKIGIAFGASWIVAASILVSVLIGLGLDKLFHTRPVFLIIMFIVGLAAGMYNLVRELRHME